MSPQPEPAVREASAGHADGPVVLSLPGEQRFASVARGLAVSCASLESFDVEELVDVRLLADEVFLAVAALGHGPVTVSLVPHAGALGIVMSASSAGRSSWSAPELEPTRRIIGVICTAAAFGIADDVVWFEAELTTLGG